MHISNVHADLLPTDVYSWYVCPRDRQLLPRMTFWQPRRRLRSGRGISTVEDLVKKPAEAMQEKSESSENWFYAGSGRAVFIQLPSAYLRQRLHEQRKRCVTSGYFCDPPRGET